MGSWIPSEAEKFILQIVVGFVGIITLIRAYMEYRRAQLWKRKEFAAQELDRLRTDPLLKFCCMAMDWHQRDVKPPVGYEIITDKPNANTNLIRHSHAALYKGLTPSNNKHFGQQGALYRDAFDNFFTYLENIESFIDNDLIEQKDVEPLNYWLRKIQADVHLSYLAYINKYKFDRVLHLMKRFHINATNCPPSKPDRPVYPLPP